MPENVNQGLSILSASLVLPLLYLCDPNSPLAQEAQVSHEACFIVMCSAQLSRSVRPPIQDPAPPYLLLNICTTNKISWLSSF